VRGSAASRGYTGGFAAELMLKDLGLAKDAADGVKLKLPLGQVAHAKYTVMKSGGEGGRDFSAIFESVMKNK
jgi:3-hydroxyisobutyrate dehydrogenase